MAYHGHAPRECIELIKRVRVALLAAPGFLVFIRQCYGRQIDLDMLEKLLLHTYSPATLRHALQTVLTEIPSITKIFILHPSPLELLRVLPILKRQISLIDEYYKCTIANLFQSVMGKADKEQLLKDVGSGRMHIRVNAQQIQEVPPGDDPARIRFIEQFYERNGITDPELRQFLLDYGHQAGIFGFEHPISSCQPLNGLLLRPNDEQLRHKAQQIMHDGRPALQITRVISYKIMNFSDSKTYQNSRKDPKYDEGYNLPHCLTLSITLKCKVYWDLLKKQFVFVDGQYTEDAEIHEEYGGLFYTNEVYQYLCQFIAVFFEGAKQIFIEKTLNPDSYANTLSRLIHKKTEARFTLVIQSKLVPIISMMRQLPIFYTSEFFKEMMQNMQTAAEAYTLLETFFIEIILTPKPLTIDTRTTSLTMLINAFDYLFTI
ncbi:MAG: hypothetical protein EXR81_00595 [Gammaproteobacteria bacterium]|nr:hypothetical protein [Gammaproteobacteria bacterium]